MDLSQDHRSIDIAVLSRQYLAMTAIQRLGFFLAACLFLPFVGGCAVVAVADAAVTVVATTVKVGATVVGTTVDVAATGVKAVAGDSEEEN